MLHAAIIGARGYLGRECVRLLLQHPQVETILPVSGSSAGTPLGDTVPAFRGRDDLVLRSFDDPAVQEADVFFFATSSGEAAALVPQLSEDAVAIDLSRDHRTQALQAQTALLATGETATGSAPGVDPHDGSWAFGLTESPLAVTKGTKRIANPGCYPTSALVGLAPLLQNGLVGDGPVIVDGKSGVSGAGATPRPDLHFAEANDDVRAYKVVGHDHGEEIQLAAGRLASGANGPLIRFTPHLIPVNRGLLTTQYIPLAEGVETADVQAAYDTAYAAAPTVRLVDEARMNNVRHTVLADLAWTLDEACHMLVVRSAIDNLLKGGSGQAVQNMNRAFGFDETMALPLIGGGP